MKKFNFDVFAAVQATVGVPLAGYRHVEVRGHKLVVRTQTQQLGDDIEVFSIDRCGNVRWLRTEQAFA